jgi:hypothetical protein
MFNYTGGLGFKTWASSGRNQNVDFAADGPYDTFAYYADN